MSNPKRIVILTGAGMSADSGLKTFRDSGGLWEGHEVEKVATPEAWKENPTQVLAFYNERRKQAHEATPHQGHKALVLLEEFFEVTIVTQNVDSLHERAGSANVIHLHGQLSKVRSEHDASLMYEIGGDAIDLGDVAEDGCQLRPHVVWFGELVPMMEKAIAIMYEADILIVIGTSLVVYPAAGLTEYIRNGVPKFIIDPRRPELYNIGSWQHIKKTAIKGTQELVYKLIETY